MDIRTVLALGGLFSAASPVTAAVAQQIEGFYVGAGVGLALVDTQPTTFDVLMGTAPIKTPASSVGFGVGFGMVGSVGYAVGDGVRFEIEGEYRRASQSQSGGGSQSAYGVFTNALYDIDLGVGWVSPYVGVGVGYQATDWNGVMLQGNAGDQASTPLTIRVSDGAGQFAYHAIVGVAFPIDAVAGLAVTAEYRYTRTAGSRSYGGEASSATAPSAPTKVHVSADASSTFLVGLRYAFEPAPPTDSDMGTEIPLAAGSRPPVARTYVVYFDWNVAVLNAKARDVIAEAARASVRVPHTRIDISGHSDQSGATEANVEISKARADAVADEMVRWGIPRGEIDVHAWGAERPAVKVAAGVREPKNRRVEIVYR